MSKKVKATSPKRSPNGSVSLQEYSNLRRFKYTYKGASCYLTLPRAGVLHPLAEVQIQRALEEDLKNQLYDVTQARYKDWIAHHGIYPKTPTIPVAQSKPLHTLFLDYLTQCGKNAEADIYFYTHVMLTKWPLAAPADIPGLLTAMNYAPRTFNTRKSALNMFFYWMIEEGLLVKHPFKFTPSRKTTDIKKLTRKALSDLEIQEILNAVLDNRFVNNYSHRYNHSHYHPILQFLAYTGVRPAEAIGLKVDKIDFKNEIVLISEVLARSKKGCYNKVRIWKSTKTGESRELSFKHNAPLRQSLLQQCAHKSPNSLVFTSPNGLAVNDRSLSEHILAPVLKGLGIPKRVLYVFRHSFATRCIKNGMDIKKVQQLTGHKDVTILLKIYAEVYGENAPIPVLGVGSPPVDPGTLAV